MRVTFAAPATIDATDTEARTLSGVVMPYGQPGRTSAGVLTVRAGALQLPTDLRRIKLYREHGRTTPIGYAVAAHDTPEALHMTFRIGATPDGDRALVEAAEGLRDAFSVEMDAEDVHAGVVGTAHLRAVAQTSTPAYDDARIAASQTDDQEDPVSTTDDTETTDESVETAEQTAASSTQVEATQVGAQITARAAGALTITGAPAPRTLVQAAAQLAASAQLRGITSASDAGEIQAALADITPVPTSNGLADAFLRPAWLGELWTPEFSQRNFVDAIGSQALTAMKWQGWKWETKPEVDRYDGNKTPIPTNPVKVVPAEGEAYRVAGGWDVDRIFLDLGSPDFISAMFTAAIADYRMKSETWLGEDLLEAATVLPDPGTLVGGLDAVVRHLTGVGARLSFLAMSADIWTTFLGLPADQVPWWLKDQASVNIADTSTDVAGIRIFTDESLPAGTLLGGDRRSVDFREAGPIRVQAVNIPNGGVDIAVFGYQGTLVNDERALVSVGVGAEGAAAAVVRREAQQAERAAAAAAATKSTRTAKDRG